MAADFGRCVYIVSFLFLRSGMLDRCTSTRRPGPNQSTLSNAFAATRFV